MTRKAVTIDGNEAAASVAFRLNEVVAIYPITPSSPMAELCDTWACRGQKEHMGRRRLRNRDAVGGRRCRRGTRRPSGGGADHDLHGIAGAPPDDTGHVQDRRRAHPLCDARRGKDAGHPCALHIRRSFRRNGLPPDGLCHAVLPAPCRKRTTWPASPRQPRWRAASPSSTFSTGSGLPTKKQRSSSSRMTTCAS